MTTLLAILLGLLAIGVVAYMGWGYLRGTSDLLSLRNFFLLGFVLFQLTSAVFPLATGDTGNYAIDDPAAAGLKFLVWAVIFLVVMLTVYRYGPVVAPLARRAPKARAELHGPMLLGLAFAVTLIAIPVRLGVRVPLIAVLADFIGVGLAATACGLLGWVWGPRLLQPLMLLPAMPILLINAANVVTGSFGRRALVAVGAGLLWGMYYSRWRYLKPRAVMWRLGLAAAGPAMVVVLFTSARASDEHDRTAIQHLQAVRQGGNLGMGLKMILDGQATGTTSMWLMQYFPEYKEHTHMAMLQYFFAYPIPRSVWVDKPEPLSTQIATMSRRRGVDRNALTIGPGILGHAAADGGWYALFVYAAFIGLLLRFFDELVVSHPTSALAVVPVGCALGQTLGLARGETSAFAFIMVFSIGSVYVLMLVASYVFRAAGLAGAGGGTLDWPEELGQDPFEAEQPAPLAQA